jgi:hypothetical protein
MSQKIQGFGCFPGATPSFFSVFIPQVRSEPVTISEHRGEERHERCFLSREQWEVIAYPLQGSFNCRLREKGYPFGHWRTGETLVERLLGKELVALAWAVEDAPLECIPTALGRWHLLSPEERWWLYSETNAATGHAQHGRRKGWRSLLRLALAEAPEPRWGRQRPPDDREFMVMRPTTKKDGLIRVYERVGPRFEPSERLLRATCAREQWNAISTPVAVYFRKRWRSHCSTERPPWRSWNDPLPRELGRELTLLLWGLEGADISLVPTVYKNWCGFRPEERWWLYGRAHQNGESFPGGQGKGWRGGITRVLQENPVGDGPPTYFDEIFSPS